MCTHATNIRSPNFVSTVMNYWNYPLEVFLYAKLHIYVGLHMSEQDIITLNIFQVKLQGKLQYYDNQTAVHYC